MYNNYGGPGVVPMDVYYVTISAYYAVITTYVQCDDFMHVLCNNIM